MKSAIADDLDTANELLLRMLDDAEAHQSLIADAQRRGVPLDDVRHVEFVPGDADDERIERTLHELEDRFAPLLTLHHHCNRCPANVSGESFGCRNRLIAPISRAAEAWLMHRIEPPDRPGGRWILGMMRELGIDGSPIAAMREKGRFESVHPQFRTLDLRRPAQTTVSSDQLFQVLLGVAHQTQPSHNLLVLVALGCIEVDGERPSDITDPVPMRRLASADTEQARRVVAALDVGRPDKDPGTARLQNWLRTMYQAWLLDVDLYVEIEDAEP